MSPRNPSHKVYERRFREHSRQLAQADIDARLFVGVFPAGISYADRGREEHGDYKRLAFLSYRTGKLDFYPGSAAFRAAIEADAKRYPPGTVIEISTSGQTVVVGCAQ